MTRTWTRTWMIPAVAAAVATIPGCNRSETNQAAPRTGAWIPSSSRAPDRGKANAIGHWRVDAKARRVIPKSGTVALPGVVQFVFDGRTVTLFLFTEKEWMWKSPDNHYRLKARWKGRDLEYLPPFGRWQRLATFDGRHFVLKGPGATVWTFRKVGKTDLLEPDDKVVLKKRALHDYSIKPTSPVN